MTTDTRTRAQRCIDVLSQMAREMEAAHRYEPQTARSVKHVLDATPFLAGYRFKQEVPRVTLVASVVYPPFYERMAFYGNVTAMRNKDVRGEIAFGCWYEGCFVALSQEEATELVKTLELPQTARERYETQVTARAARRASLGNPDDPFDGLVDTPYVSTGYAAKAKGAVTWLTDVNGIYLIAAFIVFAALFCWAFLPFDEALEDEDDAECAPSGLVLR